jgi:hypothetical protein
MLLGCGFETGGRQLLQPGVGHSFVKWLLASTMSLKICACEGMNPAIELGETNVPTSNAKRNTDFKKWDFMADEVL